MLFEFQYAFKVVLFFSKLTSDMEEDSEVDESVSAQKTEHAVHENAVA